MSAELPLLTVRRLSVRYPQTNWLPWRPRPYLRALDNLDFNLYPGETLGIVGESGCGKSTLARALAGLQTISAGAVHFEGRDLTRLTAKQWLPLRSEIQLVFQDPLAALSPRMSILKAVEAPLKALIPQLDSPQRTAKARAMLLRVGLDESLHNKRPKELSGGQCQRVGIARALVLEPKLLICDEPVSALDVSVQAQVLNLLGELQREMGLTMVFIAHDLAVVSQLCQRVLVMYAGRVMEQASREALFSAPAHPYTQALMAAIPSEDGNPGQAALPGEAPSLLGPMLGCAFRSRCPIADEHCTRVVPPLRRVAPGMEQFSACHFSRPEGLGEPVVLGA